MRQHIIVAIIFQFHESGHVSILVPAPPCACAENSKKNMCFENGISSAHAEPQFLLNTKLFVSFDVRTVHDHQKTVQLTFMKEAKNNNKNQMQAKIFRT